MKRDNKWTVVSTAIAIISISLAGCATVGNGSTHPDVTSKSSTRASNSTPKSNSSSKNKTQVNISDDIHMSTNNSGWDFSSAQGNTIEPNSIMHTDNGGKTWIDETPSQLNTQSTFSGGEAKDSNTAWFVSMNVNNSTVYHTSDGGKTWQATMLPKSYLLAWISFINSKTGWILASPGPATGQEPSDLYYTSNGGKTWSKIASASTSLPMNDGKTGISFINAETGWITIDDGWHVGQVSLYVTNDGGHTWSPQSVPVPSAMKNQYAHPLPPTFSTSVNGVLPVFFDGGEGTVFYFTTDSGDTWVPSSAVSLNNVSNLSMISSQTVWAADGHKVYMTSNGGSEWNVWTPSNSEEIVGLWASASGATATIYTLHNGKVTQYDLSSISMKS